jgi:hypothetical protein
MIIMSNDGFQLHKHEGIIIMSNLNIHFKHPLFTFSYLNFIQFKHPPTTQYFKITWHNPNAYIAKPWNKWESTILTTYAMVGKNYQWGILQHMCIMYSCIYPRLTTWCWTPSCLQPIIKLQQGHVHHTCITHGWNYCCALIINNIQSRWDVSTLLRCRFDGCLEYVGLNSYY